MERLDLREFDLECLEEIRRVRQKMCSRNSNRGGDNYELFWSELRYILHTRGVSKPDEWKQLTNEFVVGEVWTQPIGNFYYHHTVHEYTYLYVESNGLAIARHGHDMPIHDGRQIKKASEWYIFPDGKIEICDKDKKHELINDYGHPIYVISVKKSSRGR